MPNPRLPRGDQAPPRIAWTVAEVAVMVGVSYEAALALCSVNGGPIDSFHLGRLIRIPIGAPEAYMKAATVPA
jgi:hypothetical protein